jgi:hypothetical protein
MKLSKLVNPEFQVALRKLATQEVPLRTAFKLKGMIKQVNEALAKYDEVRTDALKRYGDKDDKGELVLDEGGKNVKLSEDSAQGFVKELNDLLNDEIEIGGVKVADLGENCSLSTTELMLLEDIIQD